MPQFLRVYPNPWHAFDRHGVPCGVVPTDPENDGGGPGQFVGARIDKQQTKVLQDFGEMAPHELRSPMQRTAYAYLGIASNDPELAQKLFALDPVELPVTRYYRQRLREGALLAADPETAAAAKCRFSPAQQLAVRFAVQAPVPPPPSSLPEAPQPGRHEGEPPALIGDGATDDTAAVQAAIDIAGKPAKAKPRKPNEV